jgi:hypothetical protein
MWRRSFENLALELPRLAAVFRTGDDRMVIEGLDCFSQVERRKKLVLRKENQ